MAESTFFIFNRKWGIEISHYESIFQIVEHTARFNTRRQISQVEHFQRLHHSQVHRSKHGD